MIKFNLLHWLDLFEFLYIQNNLRWLLLCSSTKTADDWSWCYVKYGNAFYNFLMSLKHSELTHWSENESFNQDFYSWVVYEY